MTEIEPFKTKKQKERDQQQEAMVALLEDTLRRAESGEFSGIAIAAVAIEKPKPEAMWAGWNASTLGYAVTCLEHRYIQAQVKT
jgi:hypothetical protein